MGDFFSSKNDNALAEEIISKSVDVLIMENDSPADSLGVLDKTVPATATFTPATSPAWTDDEKIGQLVAIQDDNDNAHEFVVADNVATNFTVDLTSDINGDDQSANYTDTVSYEFILWGTEQYIGDTDENNFNDEEENKEFLVGVPRKRRREDLLQRTVTLETIIRQVKAGILKAVHNLKDDSNSTYWVLRAGSDPSSKPRYYIILQNINVVGKVQQLRLLWTTIKSNGARVLGGGEDYEQIPAMITVDSLPISLEDQDYYYVRNEK
jgi:hypothetical protein